MTTQSGSPDHGPARDAPSCSAPRRSGYVRDRLIKETTMSYSLACGDVMPGCAATFEADSEDELLAQVGPHAAEAHGITDVTPEVLQAVKGAIKQS